MNYNVKTLPSWKEYLLQVAADDTNLYEIKEQMVNGVMMLTLCKKGTDSYVMYSSLG